MIEFAKELAEASGRLIRERYESQSFQTEEKADKSIVTATDRDAERLMRDMISKRYPNHGVIGEEYGSEKTDSRYVWTLDPIDGTISFVSGIPLFGTLIGLLDEGRPILGVINQPILGELMVGTPETTLLNDSPVRVRETRDLSTATLLTTDPHLIDRFGDTSKFEALRSKVKMTRTWGDCYGYLMLAAGRADIMLDPIMNKWDSTPLIPIIEGAGGVITDWRGEDPVVGTSIVAAVPAVHNEVIAILN